MLLVQSKRISNNTTLGGERYKNVIIVLMKYFAILYNIKIFFHYLALQDDQDYLFILITSVN